ncbi:hypothetical protein [Streptomyces venetus]|uniref:hypothetical protein n=1 Tax=Streptomyces venetus TaxID=1701086 RepID=UPI0031F15B25
MLSLEVGQDRSGGNLRGRCGVVIDVNSELLTSAASAAGAVALVFVGGWDNARRTRKAEARKDAAADRAALEAQADELVAAVLALKVAGHTHDQFFAGWQAKGRLAANWLTQGMTVVAFSRRDVYAKALAFFSVGDRLLERWDRDTAASAAGLAAPLSRLGAAAAPLMRRAEPGIAAAAEAVYEAAVGHHGDDDRMAQALETFHAVLRTALEPPPPRGPLAGPGAPPAGRERVAVPALVGPVVLARTPGSK